MDLFPIERYEEKKTPQRGDLTNRYSKLFGMKKTPKEMKRKSLNGTLEIEETPTTNHKADKVNDGGDSPVGSLPGSIRNGGGESLILSSKSKKKRKHQMKESKDDSLILQNEEKTSARSAKKQKRKSIAKDETSVARQGEDNSLILQNAEINLARSAKKQKRDSIAIDETTVAREEGEDNSLILQNEEITPARSAKKQKRKSIVKDETIVARQGGEDNSLILQNEEKTPARSAKKQKRKSIAKDETSVARQGEDNSLILQNAEINLARSSNKQKRDSIAIDETTVAREEGEDNSLILQNEEINLARSAKKQKRKSIAEDETAIVRHESGDNSLIQIDEQTPARSAKKQKRKSIAEDEITVARQENKNNSSMSQSQAEADKMRKERFKEKKRSKRAKRKEKKKNAANESNCFDNSTTEVGGFTVLGNVGMQEKATIKRVLPEWLSRPVVIGTDLQNGRTPIEDIPNLLPEIINVMKTNNLPDLFPVQTIVIPWLLQNSCQNVFPSRDICVSAPTGSGKTLSYAIPILQTLHLKKVKKLRALVVLPVKELVDQVFRVFRMFSQDLKLKVGSACGFSNLKQEAKMLGISEENETQSAVDILVATPGRLIDHLKKHPKLLKDLEYFVIDEADRMMETSSLNWLEWIERSIVQKYSTEQCLDLPGMNKTIDREQFMLSSVLTPANCHWLQQRPQKMLFSATLSQDPEKLQMIHLFQPKLFTSVVGNSSDISINEGEVKEFIGKYTTPAELKEFFIDCHKEEKPLVLYYLLKKLGYRRVLCFTRSVDTNARLCLLMNNLFSDDLKVKEFSSTLSNQARVNIWNSFNKGNIDLLLATDLAARGMDSNLIEAVVMYDVPEYVKTYVHRAGRTARAGCSGTAITFVDPSSKKHFRQLLAQAGKDNVKEMNVDSAVIEEYKELLNKAIEKVTTDH